MRTLILTVILALIPQWVSAGELEQAVQLTDEMKYPQALKIVDQILRSPKSGPVDLATAFRVRGMCLAAMGRQKQAIVAFRKLLAIQPEYEMSKKVSPKLSMPFAQAKKAATGQKAIALAHTPPASPESIAGTEIAVDLGSNPMFLVSKVRVLYRTTKGPWQQKVWKVRKPRLLKMRVPKSFKAPEMQYYFEAHVRAGGVLTRLGSSQKPYLLKAKAAVVAAAGSAAGVEEGASGAGPDGPTGKDGGGAGAGDGGGGEEAAAAGAGGKLSDAAATARLEDDGLADAGDGDPAASVDDGKDGGGRWYTAWWFWTGVGVVVAGAVVGASVAATAGDPADKTLYQVHLQ